MPIYEYEHIDAPCALGQIFEQEQSVHDERLSSCPACGGSVRKLVSRISISIPKSNSALKDMGFTKLVKRDDGVYENVTARDKESRYVHRDQPATLPNLKKTITD